eukprot:132427-Chlamydomonas_euryale.AAC.1
MGREFHLIREERLAWQLWNKRAARVGRCASGSAGPFPDLSRAPAAEASELDGSLTPASSPSPSQAAPHAPTHRVSSQIPRPMTPLAWRHQSTTRVPAVAAAAVGGAP